MSPIKKTNDNNPLLSKNLNHHPLDISINAESCNNYTFTMHANPFLEIIEINIQRQAVIFILHSVNLKKITYVC